MKHKTITVVLKKRFTPHKTLSITPKTLLKNAHSLRRVELGDLGNKRFGAPRGLLTVVSEAGRRDDRHSDHDQPAAAPHVLHEELLDHDVPETLGQDQVHLVRKGPVALLQLPHLHLQWTAHTPVID